MDVCKSNEIDQSLYRNRPAVKAGV